MHTTENEDYAEEQKTAWGVLLKNIKVYSVITVVAVLASAGYNATKDIELSSFGQPYISGKLSPMYGTSYGYNTSSNKLETYKTWLKDKTVYNVDNEKVESDFAKDRQELVEKMSQSIGERVSVTDINNAISVVESNTEINNGTAFVDFVIKNELPIVIDELDFSVVAEYEGKVYFEIPFHLKDLDLDPYKNYNISLATNVDGYEDRIKPGSKITLVGGYLK